MVQSLKVDLQETRTLIKQYNGLRSKIDVCAAKVADLESQAKGRSAVASGIKSWGGWIIAIISLLLAAFAKTIG